MNIETLKGKTFVSIEGAEAGSGRIYINDSEGNRYTMWHRQDCCENVFVEDIVGDIDDLLNSPILECEEVSSNTNPEGVTKDYQDSFTWTFYKFGTIKGHVTIRWYGESNGYYSESVDFEQVEDI